MYLKELNISNFKNYDAIQFDFSEKANCLLGPNGAGKTNILDAIHYLSFTKSALNKIDLNSVKHNCDQFALKGTFIMKNSTHEVMCDYAINAKKRIRVNGKKQNRMADHIGNYPSVLISPNDIELIWGDSKRRRKFFDSLISQIDKQYLESLISYAHQLIQRNSLLRRFSYQSVDRDLLDVYDQKMALTGNYIHGVRQSFIKKFISIFAQNYHFLVGNNRERQGVIYRSDCEGQDVQSLFKASLSKDLLFQRTTRGIHRDDFVFLLNGHPLKYMGSQGQQKSFLISLKLAEFQIIENQKGFKPLLLLDDIFDKLDDERIDKLLTLMIEGLFDQFFITDAMSNRSRNLLNQKKIKSTFFQIDKM